MKNIDDFLNAVAKKTGNDNRTATLLGINNAHVGNWRGRRSMPSNRHILTLCEHAQINVEDAIRAVEFSREHERPLKEAGFVDMGMLGILTGMSFLAVSPTPETLTGAAVGGAILASIHYANI
jgi:hypothetical protein